MQSLIYYTTTFKEYHRTWVAYVLLITSRSKSEKLCVTLLQKVMQLQKKCSTASWNLMDSTHKGFEHKEPKCEKQLELQRREKKKEIEKDWSTLMFQTSILTHFHKLSRSARWNVEWRVFFFSFFFFFWKISLRVFAAYCHATGNLE